jgi:shikimate kinase
MPRHWVLIGLMGAGKTTVGELLASRSGRRFFDNDAQLSAITGRTARRVQAEQGREALHELERQALANAVAAQPPAVIAAAASVVDDPASRELLRREADVVWLTAAVDELARRVGTEQHRPVDADARAQLREQSASRSASFAEVADIRVDADRPPSEIVDDVLVALSERTD